MKFLPIVKIAGSVTDGRQISWTFININTAPFFEIHRDNYSRIMWLDPGLTLWEGAHSRNLINSLETRHNWVNETIIPSVAKNTSEEKKV